MWRKASRTLCKPSSAKGMKSTMSPSLTSLISSETSIRPSASRNDEIKPDPSRGNLATTSCPSFAANFARQNSRRPVFLV